MVVASCWSVFFGVAVSLVVDLALHLRLELQPCLVVLWAIELPAPSPHLPLPDELRLVWLRYVADATCTYRTASVGAREQGNSNVVHGYLHVYVDAFPRCT